MKNSEKLYFGDPNDKGKYHIFTEDKRSLCGRVAMPFTTFDDEVLVKGSEQPNDTDCKPCFAKMQKCVFTEESA